MKFPIYRVEFDLNVDQDDALGLEHTSTSEQVMIDSQRPIQCRQNVMLKGKYADGQATEMSLYRMATRLADMLGILADVTSWDGCIYYAGEDTWCLHYDSHYTYWRFNTDAEALDSFKAYINDHPDEVEIRNIMREWHVCPCDTCKELGRTMILHEGKDKCQTCSSVS